MLMESLMMEDKKLDLNRPLLSVRRPISTQPSEAESKTRSYDSPSSKIPPSPPVYKSDINSGPVRNPGTVPFQWEHKPGKPKDETRSDLLGSKQSHFVPKLPPGRILNGREQDLVKKPDTKVIHQIKTGGKVSSSDKYLRKFESGNVEDASRRYDDDEDDNDTYMDATDSLSRSESFFLNCSVSGVSELDGHEGLHPFGTFSSDRQAQDLMMGRFLPAAKALTTETHPHSARKPPKPEEQPKHVKKVVVKERQKTAQQNPYRFHHSPDQEDERNTNMAFGVCGLVPQICLKSSLGVLNPVPSVRMQAQRAVSVRRLRSKYQGSTPHQENDNKALKPRGEESACVTQKPNESVAQGSSLPVSSISEGKEKLEKLRISATPGTKVSRNFGELLASDDNESKPSSEIPVAEKTLYVDTVHSLHTKEEAESKEESVKGYCPSLDAPVKDVQNLLGFCEEAILQPKRTEQVNVNRDDGSVVKVAESHQIHSEHEVGSKQCVKEGLQDCNQAIIPLPKEKIDLEVQEQRITTTTHGNSIVHHRSHHLVTPPPLPKAPSDSWLKRTLPTIPSKNSFTWSSSLGIGNTHFTKIQAFHISEANPKWETMVKTSNTQQGFVHFSKETLNSIPEA